MSRIAEWREQWRQHREDSRAWGGTQSMADLAEQNRAWLRGEREVTPGHGGPPNQETELIRNDLDRLNQRGFVTTGSQPGLRERDDEGEYEQRAFVEGYTDRDTASRIERVARETQCEHEECDGAPAITVKTQPVAEFRHWWQRDERPAEAVSVYNGQVVTSNPPSMKHGWFDLQWSGVGEGAEQELRDSVHVEAVDNHWGDSRALWNVLDRAWEEKEDER